MAYLNAELKHGDSLSFDAVFKRAINESRGKIIHLNMAEILEQSSVNSDQTAVLSMFERALKKYKYSKKVWSAYQCYCLRQKNVEKAKSLLQRSLQSLSKHKHVQVCADELKI
jgi:rRNA biogenesis protein RRP5